MGDEREARGDRLRGVDQVFADEGLAIAEPVGEHDRLTVLAEDVRIAARGRMHGLDEEAELRRGLHVGSPRP